MKHDSGCNVFDVNVKLYFMQLMENETFVAQRNVGGTKQLTSERVLSPVRDWKNSENKIFLAE
jgi:hypothetical protein